MIIGIIGGGAAGMAAAIEASGDSQNRVILFERQARVGRKLQATGNGRCNLTNLFAAIEHYHGQQAEFVRYALEQFGVENTLSWFKDLGLFTVSEDSGRVYPYSDQANSVVDVLRFAMERDNITVYTGVEIKKIKKQNDGFCIEADEQQEYCDRLIIACGGLAGTKLGGTMSGYKLLAKFGHKCTKLRPALVQLKSNWGALASLKGVRANCSIQILNDDVVHSQSAGELQFTEYGLSGPVIFEVSRDVCAVPGDWGAQIDFRPHVSEQELAEELYRRVKRAVPVSDVLTGMLHNRLGRVLAAAAGISNSFEEHHIPELCEKIKNFRISLTEPMGMDSAQVTAGGVLTEQFDPQTMESKLTPGLYACGEVLDIDGDCGGYNLQWAWSSGRLAGRSAGKE